MAKTKFKVHDDVPMEIVSVGPNATKADFERALGQVTMKIGKQQEIVQKEQVELQKLHKAANIVATEIEKLDG